MANVAGQAPPQHPPMASSLVSQHLQRGAPSAAAFLNAPPPSAAAGGMSIVSTNEMEEAKKAQTLLALVPEIDNVWVLEETLAAYGQFDAEGGDGRASSANSSSTRRQGSPHQHRDQLSSKNLQQQQLQHASAVGGNNDNKNKKGMDGSGSMLKSMSFRQQLGQPAHQALFAAVEALVSDKDYVCPKYLMKYSLSKAGSNRSVLRLDDVGFTCTLETFLAKLSSGAATEDTQQQQFPALSQADVFNIYQPVQSAVRFLHSRGIAHGSVQPSNIYLWLSPADGRAILKAKLGGLHTAMFTEQRNTVGLGTWSGSSGGQPTSPFSDDGGDPTAVPTTSPTWSNGAYLPPEFVFNTCVALSHSNSGNELNGCNEDMRSVVPNHQRTETRTYTSPTTSHVPVEKPRQQPTDSIAADVWALGIVLFQLLYGGELPFGGVLQAADNSTTSDISRGSHGLLEGLVRIASSSSPVGFQHEKDLLSASGSYSNNKTVTDPFPGLSYKSFMANHRRNRSGSVYGLDALPTQQQQNSATSPRNNSRDKEFLKIAQKYVLAPEPLVEAPLFRKLLPKLLAPRSRRISCWTADAMLLQWTVLVKNGFGMQDLSTKALDAAATQAKAEGLTLYNAIAAGTGPKLHQIVALLQNKNTSLTISRRPDRKIPMHAAVLVEDTHLAMEVCDLLLTSSKNPATLLEIQSYNRRTPLQSCIENAVLRRWDLFEFLLNRAHELDLLSVAANIRTLRFCAERNLTIGVNHLMSHWSNLSWPNNTVSSVVQDAAANNAMDACRIMLGTISSPSTLSEEVRKAVCAAAENSQTSACSELLRLISGGNPTSGGAAGDDAGLVLEDGNDAATVALFAACENDLNDVVELALQYNADALAFDNNGDTAVHIAASKGHHSALNALFTHMPKSRSALATAQVDAVGRTALHYAAQNGWGDCVLTLMDNGAAPNACDPERFTPLHLAAKAGWTSVCNKLIDYNAWIDATLPDGTTPALMAAKSGEVECIRDSFLPNGASLGRLTDGNVRTVYHELLLRLADITEELNALERCNGATIIVIGAVVWCLAVAVGCVLLTSVSATGGFTWYHIATLACGLVIHAAVMIAARYSVEDPGASTQELFNDVMPMKTMLKASAAGVPMPVAEEVQKRLSDFRHQLAPLKSNYASPSANKGNDPLAFDADLIKTVRHRVKKWTRRFPHFPEHVWRHRRLEEHGGTPHQLSHDSVGVMESLLSTPTPGSPSKPLPKSQCADGDHSMQRLIAKSIRHETVPHFALQVEDEVKFLEDHLSVTVNPSRKRTLREAYLTVLAKAEASEGTPLLELPSPFVSMRQFQLHATAFIHSYPYHVALRVLSTMLMVIVFVGFGTIVFSRDGAEGYHFVHELHEACTDVDALTCSDWRTNMAVLKTGSADCCFGEAKDNVTWCPAANAGSSGGGSSFPPLDFTTVLHNATERIVYLNASFEYNSKHDSSLLSTTVSKRGNATIRTPNAPIGELIIKGCTLEQPRPKITVRVVLPTEDDRDSKLDGVAVLFTIIGAAVFFAEIAVSIRWARRKRFSYFIHETQTFENSLLKFYFLSMLHTALATLTFRMAISLFLRAEFEDIETLGVTIGVLSIYPGLAILSWLPRIGSIVASTLLSVLLGLLFVLGMIMVFPLIPAIEAFSIPFFVTDPQRAIVSFSSVTSSRIFYVAIAVFWLLLLLRVITAAATALAPGNMQVYYQQMMRQYRLATAMALQDRGGKKNRKKRGPTTLAPVGANALGDGSVVIIQTEDDDDDSETDGGGTASTTSTNQQTNNTGDSGASSSRFDQTMTSLQGGGGGGGGVSGSGGGGRQSKRRHHTANNASTAGIGVSVDPFLMNESFFKAGGGPGSNQGEREEDENEDDDEARMMDSTSVTHLEHGVKTTSLHFLKKKQQLQQKEVSVDRTHLPSERVVESPQPHHPSSPQRRGEQLASLFNEPIESFVGSNGADEEEAALAASMKGGHGGGGGDRSPTILQQSTASLQTAGSSTNGGIVGHDENHHHRLHISSGSEERTSERSGRPDDAELGVST